MRLSRRSRANIANARYSLPAAADRCRTDSLIAASAQRAPAGSDERPGRSRGVNCDAACIHGGKDCITKGGTDKNEEYGIEGLGGGLTALAFWGFIAAVVVAGIWYSIREREAQHETFRRVVESGQAVDQELLDKVFGGDRILHRDLKIGGLIVLSCAPGLAAFGWFLSFISDAAFMAMLGVAALAAFVGLGLLVASRAARNSGQQSDAERHKQDLAL